MIPVPYFDYLNVRIRGYHSHLFTRDTCEDLLGGDNLGGLTTFLLDQPTYREDIEKALEGQPERKGLERGVTDYFARRISNILHMAHEKARHLFETALYSFDLKNLRSVVIAHNSGLSFYKAQDMFIPCGSLNRDDLSLMLSAPDLDEIAHILAGCCPLGAEALRETLMATSGNEPFVKFVNRMEQNIYRKILRFRSGSDSDMRILTEVFRLEIDLKNVASALKFVWEGVQSDRNNSETFIPGGTISVRYLNEISEADSLDEAFEMLESTPFRPAVEKGIIYFAETGFLHEMERFFEEVFIRKTQSYHRFNPFGIGVFIGYLWAQFTELTNLRTIINGIAFSSGVGQIRKGLIYV